MASGAAGGVMSATFNGGKAIDYFGGAVSGAVFGGLTAAATFGLASLLRGIPVPGSGGYKEGLMTVGYYLQGSSGRVLGYGWKYRWNDW